VRVDDRVFAMCQFKSLPLDALMQSVYPDLYPLHNLTDEVCVVAKITVFVLLLSGIRDFFYFPLNNEVWRRNLCCQNRFLPLAIWLMTLFGNFIIRIAEINY